jgi:tetratricopeptide (TPR) repeat protein
MSLVAPMPPLNPANLVVIMTSVWPTVEAAGLIIRETLRTISTMRNNSHVNNATTALSKANWPCLKSQLGAYDAVMTMSESPSPLATVPQHWGNVPQRNKNFTGREDILGRLRRDTPSNVTAVIPSDPLPRALQGFGGVGKTAIAVEYAYRYQANYDLVWWIPAEQITLVRSSLAALATKLGLEAASATGIEATTTAVLDALRRGVPVRRWLLIFDNADQPEDLKSFIPHGPGDVLITSRNHAWQQEVESVEVDVFNRKESVEFLTKRVPKVLSDRDADRLAEQLGDLPLALVQASAMLAQGVMPVEEYLRLIEKEIAKILSEGTPPEYPAPMTAVWKLSMGRVTKQQPKAQELLRCCAFFGPEPIPPQVFRRASYGDESGINELIAQPILLASAIRELGRFALIRIDGANISVHRLTQALVRADLSPEQQAKYRQEVHGMLAAGSPLSPTDASTWPRWSELVGHVSSEVTDLAHCRVHEHRDLAVSVVRYLYQSGDFWACQALARRFSEEWAVESGSGDPHVLDARRRLGNALRELGQYQEARETIEATMARAEQALGLRNPLTLALRNAHGADLRAYGDFAAARELDERTLELHVDQFGDSDPQTLRVKNNLALDLGLNSKYEEAKKLQESVYLMQRDAPGGVSSTDVLNSHVGLARAVRLCGGFLAARDLGEDAVAFGRHEFGPEHYLTLRAATDLSIAMRRVPDGHADALELAQEVFKLSEPLLGARDPGTMAAAVSLANNLRVTRHLDEALELAEATRDNYRLVYGPDHPYTYACTGNVAVLHRLKGNAAYAQELDEAARVGLAGRLSLDHFYTLTVAANLASDMAALGDADAACTIGEDIRARLWELVGPDHFLTLGCAANLALDLRAIGADAEAEAMYAETVSRFTSVFGNDNPETETAVAGERLNFDFDPPPI